MASEAPETNSAEAAAGTEIAVPTPRPPAKLEVQENVRAVLPTNIEEAQRYALGIVKSGIVPDAFTFQKDEYEHGTGVLLQKKGEPNAPLILMGILKVMELGMPPQTGLAWLLPLRGRFTIWGDGATALIQSKRLIKNHVVREIGPEFDPATPLGEWPEEFGIECRYWRVGQDDPYIGRYTVRDAKRAGLWMNSSKKPWLTDPKRMLFNRARAFALRDGFADALAGLAIAEEVKDFTRDEDPAEPRSARISRLLDDDDTETTTEGEAENADV